MHGGAVTEPERPQGSWVERLDRRLYPHHGDNWDDELFRSLVLDRLRPEDEVLDLGAGAGIVPQMDFRGRARRVCGIDPDPRVVENPHLDEGRVASGEAIPYPDESFDLVVSDNVVEHLSDPVAVFREVQRVLRPGGLFLLKTPNLFHYVAGLARLTPLGFHRFVNRLRGRAVEDTFPTRYRANSPGRLADCARAAGLELLEVRRHEGRPEYLRFSAPTYLLGFAYERLVNSSPRLEGLRVLLTATLRKPGPGAAA